MSDPVNPPAHDVPTDSPELTDYDRAHFKEYLMILDGDAAGASWQEIMRIVFKIDPDADPSLAKSSYDAHLARAKWMTQVGFRHLLEGS